MFQIDIHSKYKSNSIKGQICAQTVTNLNIIKKCGRIIEVGIAASTVRDLLHLGGYI